jgi:hypothetical protein
MQPIKDLRKAADYHRDRAMEYQTRHMLHATSGKPGRAKVAQSMYNYHMRKLAEIIVSTTGQPAQMFLMP